MGYLDEEYLKDDYFDSGVEFNSIAFQYQTAITYVDVLKDTSLQYRTDIDNVTALPLQFQSNISKEKSLPLQFQSVISKEKSLPLQFQSVISKEKSLPLQFQAVISKEKSIGFQFEPPTLSIFSFQYDSIISRNKQLASEYNQANFVHVTSDSGYLNDIYLNNAYFTKSSNSPNVLIPFEYFIQPEIRLGFQFEQKIVDNIQGEAFQFLKIISQPHPIPLQYQVIISSGFSFQYSIVFYNKINLRILYEFPSRGTSGTNWTATSTMAGDFSPNNLNTDIVEQVWRSNTGALTNVQLTCDTQIPQGSFIDTIGILGHNLTRSAIVTVTLSQFSNFSQGVSFNLTPTRNEMIWVADDLPNNSYRYFRLTVTDTSNPDNFLQIGTIVFGSSVILKNSNFTNPVKFKKTHYSDSVTTEGFSTISNDRGVKKSFDLDFRSININTDDYQSMQAIFDTLRTNLKGLWIPTPLYPLRFAVFGKLAEIPQEEHTDIDDGNAHSTFSVTVSEDK